MPILRGSLSNFVCFKNKVMDAGDHTILIGEVIDCMTNAGKPLLYFKGKYVSN